MTTRTDPRLPLAALTLLGALSLPGSLLAQRPVQSTIAVRAPDVRPVAQRRCSLAERDPLVRRAEAMLGTGAGEESLAALRRLEGALRPRAAEAPDDVDARYRLATVIAVRLELGDGDEVELASEVHRHAAKIVALDPRHPGAHHMLGRLHAAVMRLSGFKRFLAKTFVGGELLESASWKAARRHLELAEALQPCIPDHHYELARLLFERGRPEDALAEIEHVRSLRELPGGRGAIVALKADTLVETYAGEERRTP